MAVVKRWWGEERRDGSGLYQENPERFEVTMERAKFHRIIREELHRTQVWDLPSILGHLYSTSFSKRSLFGDNLPAFEADLSATLLALHPDGTFEQQVPVEYVFAWVQ